jgi:hypothetical protein
MRRIGTRIWPLRGEFPVFAAHVMSQFLRAENKRLENQWINRVRLEWYTSIRKVLNHTTFLEHTWTLFSAEQERIEIILLCQCDGWADGQVADGCNNSAEEIQWHVAWNMMVHYRVHKNPLDPALKQM